jgi:DNA primase
MWSRIVAILAPVSSQVCERDPRALQAEFPTLTRCETIPIIARASWMARPVFSAKTGELGQGGPFGYWGRIVATIPPCRFRSVDSTWPRLTDDRGSRVALRSSFDDKERVRQAIDIVDLVGSYLQLRREGRGYKALCPWHDDTRPSLQVNPERQSFKCWVCDIGGDIFSFMMKMENVEFPEALSMLADRAGIQLTPHRAGDAAGGASPAALAGSPDDKRTLYQAAAWAEQQFHECLLKSAEAEPALRYLRERGIDDESIRRFHLGFAPDRWDWLIQRSLKPNISPKVLERIGLLVRKDGGGHYDRFKGRVLFSIRDTQGRPIAVGGRILPEAAATNPAKYINSPESPLFSKSNMLYGLDLAREAITKSRVAIVMEGYTDCIVARQFGFENVLAVLGTALGDRHIRLLRRFADTIVLVLDGDEAGRKRTSEILSLFVAEQVDLRIVTLPDDLDPCDFLLAHGAEAFRTHLDAAVDGLEHAFRMATRGLDIHEQPHEANQALEALLETIAKAPRLRDGTTQAMRMREWTMLLQLAKKFGRGDDEEFIRQRVTELRGKPRSGSQSASDDHSSRLEPLNAWDRELLEILLLRPDSIRTMSEVIHPEHISSEACRRIFAAACSLASDGDIPSFDRLLLEFDDPQYKNLLVELDERGQAKGAHDLAVRLHELLEAFRRRDHERQLRAQTRALKERKLGAAEELAALAQLIDQERRRQGISAPTDG